MATDLRMGVADGTVLSRVLLVHDGTRYGRRPPRSPGRRSAAGSQKKTDSRAPRVLCCCCWLLVLLLTLVGCVVCGVWGVVGSYTVHRGTGNPAGNREPSSREPGKPGTGNREPGTGNVNTELSELGTLELLQQRRQGTGNWGRALGFRSGRDRWTAPALTR